MMTFLVLDLSYSVSHSNLFFLQDFRDAVESTIGEDEEPLLDKAKLDEILSTLPQVFHLHTEILNELETRIKQW